MKRTILVTGGNRGIGLATVKKLAENAEDTILLGCRDLNHGKEVAGELGANAVAVKLDVTTRDGLKSDVEEIFASYPSIDVLINNAGVLNEENFFEIEMQVFDQSMRVNAVAPFELIQLMTPKMKEKSYGRIVNVSSGWGTFNEGLAGPFSYSVSKATLNAITKTISQTLGDNILINAACPGWVHTRMGGEQAPRTPEEGADTIVWLANLPEGSESGNLYRDRKKINW